MKIRERVDTLPYTDLPYKTGQCRYKGGEGKDEDNELIHDRLPNEEEAAS